MVQAVGVGQMAGGTGATCRPSHISPVLFSIGTLTERRDVPIPDARREAGVEDITNRIVDWITEGLIVVEDSQCPSCAQPLVFNPRAPLTKGER